MNLSVIWDKLDEEDRLVLINILKHDKWWNKDTTWNINNDTSQGKLVFLDMEEVFKSLREYAKHNINQANGKIKYQRVMRIIGLIKWKLASRSLKDYGETGEL